MCRSLDVSRKGVGQNCFTLAAEGTAAFFHYSYLVSLRLGVHVVPLVLEAVAEEEEEGEEA